MEFPRFTSAVNGSGVTVVTPAEDATLGTVIVDAIKSPLNAFSSAAESRLITEREAGIQAATHLVVGGLAGELIGHRRAADGKAPFLRVVGL